MHEYQSKHIMKSHGINTTDCDVVESEEQAFNLATTMFQNGAKKVVVKSQIHAGGRGKGSFKETGFQGGVHLADNAKQAQEFAKAMLGNHLVTKQTGPFGQKVSKLLLEASVDIAEEKYFAILMDRKSKGPAIIASPEGGMNIEEVAHTNPNAVRKVPINITKGITDSQAYEIVDFLGGSDPTTRDGNMEQIKNLYNLFTSTDATQVEINPLIVGKDRKFRAIDAKLNFDDSAAFRQKEIFGMRDVTMEDARDVQAAKFDLNYVGLDGSIGCLVNGAGLALATMDVIKLNGGEPANFLDVGGGASAKAVEEAFKLITSDKKVNAIMVNIFGGIMKCDVIADGIITAAKNLDLKIPLIVRLEGTNVKHGLELLSESGLAIIPAQSLDEAAKKAVQAANAYAATKH